MHGKVVVALTLFACHRDPEPRLPARVTRAPDCAARGTADYATPLRGPVTEPDPRTAATLTGKGFTLDAAGIARALADDRDPTAQLAALTATSALQCRGLLPRVESLLVAPAPIAVEAAATYAELGTAAQRTRAHARLHEALRDPSWPEVQVTAAVYLGRAGDVASVPAIRAALRSTTEAVRLQAVVSLSAFAGFDGQAPGGAPFTRLAELATVLGDPASSWLVRREAVYQLARLPASPERMALLVRVATDDADERVRRAATLRVGP